MCSPKQFLLEIEQPCVQSSGSQPLFLGPQVLPVFSFKLFFYTHLGYSLNFTVVYHCQVMGGIPQPSGGIVGKNRSTLSKTTVRSIFIIYFFPFIHYISNCLCLMATSQGWVPQGQMGPLYYVICLKQQMGPAHCNHWSNCMQNNVTTAGRSLSRFRKKPIVYYSGLAPCKIQFKIIAQYSFNL